MTDVLDRLPVLDDAARSALFTDARTAVRFTDEPVSDEVLTDVYELAKWAPTGANTQPLRVLYVNSPDARAKLVARMAEGNQEKTAVAPAVAVLAFDTRYHEHMPHLAPFRPGMREMLEDAPEMRANFGTLSSHLQAGYFILSVRAHGLAAGPMGGFDAAGVDADFFPDGRLHSFLVVNIGYPADDAYHPRAPRLDAGQAVDFV